MKREQNNISKEKARSEKNTQEKGRYVNGRGEARRGTGGNEKSTEATRHEATLN